MPEQLKGFRARRRYIGERLQGLIRTGQTGLYRIQTTVIAHTS